MVLRNNMWLQDNRRDDESRALLLYDAVDAKTCLFYVIRSCIVYGFVESSVWVVPDGYYYAYQRNDFVDSHFDFCARALQQKSTLK